METHISIFNTYLQQIRDTNPTYIFDYKAREAFLDILQSIKTNFWKLSASKESTPLLGLQKQMRDW